MCPLPKEPIESEPVPAAPTPTESVMKKSGTKKCCCNRQRQLEKAVPGAEFRSGVEDGTPGVPGTP